VGDKKYLTGFDHAFQMAMTHTPLLSEETIPIMDAVGRIVSRDIFARINAPSVNSSLKDGYAVISEDLKRASMEHPVPLDLIGTIEAGSSRSYVVTRGKCVRILTGAPIPQGSDAVLAGEFAKIDGNRVFGFADAHPSRNIMLEGTDVGKGERLLREGSEIGPSVVSLLVAGGITEVPVRKKPRVGLLATGDEILLPGAEFKPGKLFASNMALQEAWLKSRGFNTRFSLSGDTHQALSHEVAKLLEVSDAIVTSGGAWEGDRDLIVSVLEALGWKKLFHHVRMGPGKAVGMGLIDGKPIFCLPGGPPSNEMAFLMIAYPAICKMAGYGPYPFVRLCGELLSPVRGETAWTQFIHCTVEKKGDHYLIQPIKLASRLKSMADAKAILSIPEGVSVIEEGADVTVHLLDHAIMKTGESPASCKRPLV
jgi:molybdopterin molybdotransferase